MRSKRNGGTRGSCRPAWIAALALFAVPSHAAAQLGIDFNDWTSDCIAGGSCGTTRVVVGPGASLDTMLDCPNPGRCLDARSTADGEVTLLPNGGDWTPAPKQFAVSLWLRVDESSFPPGPIRYAELARAYCAEADCSALVEVHDDGTDVKLVVQIENPLDTEGETACSLPFAIDGDWHHVVASVALAETGLAGDCSIALDATESTSNSFDFIVSSTIDNPLTFRELRIGGQIESGTSESRIRLDDVCIAPTVDELGCVVSPPSDGGVPTDFDGGTGRRDGGSRTPQPDATYRGGGGCVCRAAPRARENEPLGALLLAAIALIAPLRARRTRARRR